MIKIDSTVNEDRKRNSNDESSKRNGRQFLLTDDGCTHVTCIVNFGRLNSVDLEKFLQVKNDLFMVNKNYKAKIVVEIISSESTFICSILLISSTKQVS